MFIRDMILKFLVLLFFIQSQGIVATPIYYDTSDLDPDLQEQVESYDGYQELRDNHVWLSKKDIDKILLDGQVYVIDKSVLEADDFSHVGITYPAIILSGDTVKSLIDNKTVITQGKMIAELDKVWGESVAKEPYIWYGQVQIAPENFEFLDYAKFSNDQKLLGVSAHAFLADILDSIVCVYDVKNNEYKFIKKPFYGAINEMTFTDDNKYLAYSYYTGGDTLNYYVSVLSLDTMEILYEMELNEYVQIEKGLTEDSYLDTFNVKVRWSDKTLYADFSYDFIGNEKECDVTDMIIWQEE